VERAVDSDNAAHDDRQLDGANWDRVVHGSQGFLDLVDHAARCELTIFVLVVPFGDFAESLQLLGVLGCETDPVRVILELAIDLATLVDRSECDHELGESHAVGSDHVVERQATVLAGDQLEVGESHIDHALAGFGSGEIEEVLDQSLGSTHGNDVGIPGVVGERLDSGLGGGFVGVSHTCSCAAAQRRKKRKKDSSQIVKIGPEKLLASLPERAKRNCIALSDGETNFWIASFLFRSMNTTCQCAKPGVVYRQQ
jgi:hypothetical protein